MKGSIEQAADPVTVTPWQTVPGVFSRFVQLFEVKYLIAGFS